MSDLPNCAVECATLCQMSTHGYCQRSREKDAAPAGSAEVMEVGRVRFTRKAGDVWAMGVIGSDLTMDVRLIPRGGWSDSGPVEGA